MPLFIVIASLVVLILIHELGHFAFAKYFGVRVDEFGIGIPPRLFGKKIGETLYSINLFPLGGFVKMQGEDKAEPGERSFSEKPIYQRAIILFAGVAAFFIMAIVIFSVVSTMGVRHVVSAEETNITDPQVMVMGVAPDSPAENAGVKMGDVIFGINGKEVTTIDELVSEINDEKVTLSFLKGEEVIDLELTPRVDYPEEEGAVGLSMVLTSEESYPFYIAPLQGVKMTFNITSNVIFGFYSMISSFVTGSELPPGMEIGGPVKIVEVGAESMQRGLVDYLNFIGIISISLAVLNILPIPALDGGRLLFLGIEKIKGSAISQKLEQNLNAVFFLLLITLMIFVTFKDIQGIL